MRNGPDYQGEIGSAVISWYSTPTKLYFHETTNYSVAQMVYYGQSSTQSWWGLTVPHPCTTTGNCTYNWTEEYVNSRTIGQNNSFRAQKVAAHETGHGLGLAHTTASGVTSIMFQGDLGYNTPQSYDISNINTLYP
jgi:hypothetical protein